ncbi:MULTISPECIES: PHB depolymerase family esterase [unclassified Corynebacterium]|nr:MULTISPECIES: PHB depolymerase family esterase [unclassified Corynebacterium]MCS4532092.1 polyhydroxybutyrate depolymerase [Corynebacterium sp. ES2730-CONJ]
MAVAAFAATFMTSVLPATAQAQLPLPPEVQGAIDNARTQVERTVNDIQRQLAQGSSSSAPLPLPPAPAGWRPSQPQPVANGGFGALWVNTPYGNRRFLIDVPAGYDAARPFPVMVGIPAYQDTSENFRNYSRLKYSSIGRDAIIVYPDSWNQSWEGNPTATSAPGQDIDFIRRVIDRVQASYNIDRGRIYATGMSTGSGMAAVLGCHASDLFAGVAPVSGAYFDAVDSNCKGNPIAFINVHGMSDQQHNYNGGFRYGLHYYGGREMMERYAQRNRCWAGRTEHPLPGGATKVVAQGCAAPTEHIRVPGGHLWWYTPSTADEIWSFLSRQRR